MSIRFRLIFLAVCFLLTVIACLPANPVSNVEPLDLISPAQTLTAKAIQASPPVPTRTLIPTSTPSEQEKTDQNVSVSGYPTHPAFYHQAIPTLRPDTVEYTVESGDTISKIAALFRISKQALITENDIKNPDIISVGDVFVIPAQSPDMDDKSPSLLPDELLVNGPAIKGFSIQEFLAAHPNNILSSYREPTPTPIPPDKNGKPVVQPKFIVRNGDEILEQISIQQSISPKILLALMEFQSGTISANQVNGKQKKGILFDGGTYYIPIARQLSWTADTLNFGYYQWKYKNINQWILDDDTIVAANPEINAGTAAIQYLFSKIYDKENWLYAVSKNGFIATYESLFGAFEDEPIISESVPPPIALELPFAQGETWSFTSGPHYGWSDGSPWAALDFAPPDIYGCSKSSYWITASAPGEILYAKNALVIEDLDGDHDLRTGWNLVYLHLDTDDFIKEGSQVKTGDHLGHPSCEGGLANGSHVHLARRYNGEWIPIDGKIPFILSGWEAFSEGKVYDGYLVKGDEIVEAWYFKTEASDIKH